MGPQQPANFPFAIGEVAITKGPVVRMATLLTPKNPMVFGRERLKKVQVSTGLSPVEQWMVEHARTSGERARITILRAANAAGERVWSFDPSFDNDTLREAGYVLTKGLLPLHRALMAAGVMLMVHTDWGAPESYGIRHGVWRCVDELSAKTTLTADESSDLWVLKNMVHHVSLSLDHVVRSTLPQQISMVDHRWDRLRARLSA